MSESDKVARGNRFVDGPEGNGEWYRWVRGGGSCLEGNWNWYRWWRGGGSEVPQVLGGEAAVAAENFNAVEGDRGGGGGEKGEASVITKLAYGDEGCVSKGKENVCEAGSWG